MATKASQLNNQSILITGGTGSFGNNVVEKLLSDFTPKEIIVFSRDEKKQFDMRNKFRSPTLQFIIGDVRNRETVFKVMRNIDYVFHAAALKQVPTCEFFPNEAVETNVIGALNVLDAAEEYGVKKVVVLGTDKAVYPINAMGMTKADLLVIPLDFDEMSIRFARYSMPGKTSEYMASGTPILVYAPERTALSMYAKREKWGYSVNRRDVTILC